MSEQMGSAPRPSAQEQQRTPERERVSSERVGLTTRLLLGTEALNPNKTDLPPVNLREITRENLHKNTVTLMKLSDNERKTFWESKEENNFDRQKQAWVTQVKETLTKKITTGSEQEQNQWKEMYKRFDLEGDITDEKLLSFYDKYFTGENANKSLVKFTQDVLNSYTSDNIIDFDKVQSDVEKISWFANIFGESSSKILPSLIEANFFFTAQGTELRRELLQKANAKEHEIARVNRLTDEEKSLLEKLMAALQETSVPPTPRETRSDVAAGNQEVETPPTERKPAIIITKEQVEALKKRKTKLTGSTEEISYEEIVDKLIDIKTGKPKDETVDLILDTNDFVSKILTNNDVRARVAEAFGKSNDVITIAPSVWAALDKIATHSNEQNKELAFVLQGLNIPVTEANKNLFAATHAVAAHDFTTAEEKRAHFRTDVFTENAQDVATKTNLDKYFIEQGKAKVGEYIISLHTHQAPLGEESIATPSPVDEQRINLWLNQQNAPYRWGILTKDRQGNLNIAMFVSEKDDRGVVHHKRIATLSPDLTEVKTIPDDGFGEN